MFIFANQGYLYVQSCKRAPINDAKYLSRRNRYFNMHRKTCSNAELDFIDVSTFVPKADTTTDQFN